MCQKLHCYVKFGLLSLLVYRKRLLRSRNLFYAQVFKYNIDAVKLFAV